MASTTMSPTAESDVVTNNIADTAQEEVVGPVPEVQLVEPVKEPSTVYHKAAESGLPNLASLETQPTIPYNTTLPQSQSIEYLYDLEKNPTYSPLYTVPFPYENDQYGQGSLDPNNVVPQQLETQPSQGVNQVKTAQENPEGFKTELTDQNIQQGIDPNNPYLSPIYSPEGLLKPQNKVVAVNPVILVDKVERSLIVQWYENSVKREQRISYKKYGNAKAQQRAEGLISKLLAGSTFDQLYPEKGPPILTIFENVGKYMVSLTRDRIVREWRVDWLNNNGTKMRARWSCKKVGNEEARKRAEAFAYSLIQGTFNPRLLHKATGTRLSKNDMKYNAVVSGLNSQIESKAMNQLNESNWQNVDAQPKRKTKKRSVKGSEQKKGRSRRRSMSAYSDATTASSMTGANLNNPLGTGAMTASITSTIPTTTANTAEVAQYMKSHCYPFMNMVQDPNFPGTQNYYAMYPEDVDSAVTQQLDPNAGFSQGLMQQGWMDWNGNNLQKMMPFSQDVDYTANPALVDYPFFSQQGTGSINSSSSMAWDPLNYPNMNLYLQQSDMQTGREFDDQSDTRLTNQYYGYYGNEQFGFQENMLSQEQMMMGYYNYPNTIRVDPGSWNEENKDYSKFAKEYAEDVKQDGTDDKELAQVTTLANYKNLTGAGMDNNELPPQNLSVSTRLYTSEHYGYINADLGDVKQEDHTLNCFTELEDPLSQQGNGSASQQAGAKKTDFQAFPKDKFTESYDNPTYREMDEPVMYYSM